MTTAPPTPAIGDARRWAILAASTLAQAAAAVMIHGAAFLIPALHDQEGLSLARGGLIVAAPTLGVMLALVGWGWLADRHGERIAMLAGLTVTTIAGALAALSSDPTALGLLLVLAGVGAASTNASSGRVVVGWFPPHRRGLAMGIRQMAQPAGVAVAAPSVAIVAEHHGAYASLWVPTCAAALAVLAVLLIVIDPPRPDRTTARTPNPYRTDSYLARIHTASMLLVIPQFVVWTFTLAWLVQAQHWSPAAAGTLVAVTQVLGAVGRIAAGQLSDMVRSRLRPMRWVAAAVAVVMLAFGLTDAWDWAIAVPLAVLAGVVTVAPNGLAFTAVAERAGPFWSGRSLGLHNTAQFLVSSAVAPLGGLAIAAGGYALTFAAAGVVAAIALALVPAADEDALT